MNEKLYLVFASGEAAASAPGGAEAEIAWLAAPSGRNRLIYGEDRAPTLAPATEWHPDGVFLEPIELENQTRLLLVVRRAEVWVNGFRPPPLAVLDVDDLLRVDGFAFRVANRPPPVREQEQAGKEIHA